MSPLKGFFNVGLATKVVFAFSFVFVSVFFSSAAYAVGTFAQTGRYYGTVGFPSISKKRPNPTAQSWQLNSANLNLNAGLNMGDPCSASLGSFINAIKSDFSKKYLDSFTQSLNIAVDPAGMLTGLTARYLAPELNKLTENIDLGFNGLFLGRLASCRELFHGERYDIKDKDFLKKLGNDIYQHPSSRDACDGLFNVSMGGYITQSDLFTPNDNGRDPGEDLTRKIFNCAKKASSDLYKKNRYDLFIFNSSVDPSASENYGVVKAKAEFISGLAAVGLQPLLISKEPPGATYNPISRTITDDQRFSSQGEMSGNVVWLSSADYPVAYVNNKVGPTKNALYATYQIMLNFFAAPWNQFVNFVTNTGVDSGRVCNQGGYVLSPNLCIDKIAKTRLLYSSATPGDSFANFASSLTAYGKASSYEGTKNYIRRILFWMYVRDALGLLPDMKLAPVHSYSRVKVIQSGDITPRNRPHKNAEGVVEGTIAAPTTVSPSSSGGIIVNTQVEDFNAGSIEDFSYPELLRRLKIEFNISRGTVAGSNYESVPYTLADDFMKFIAMNISQMFLPFHMLDNNSLVTESDIDNAWQTISEKVKGIRAACMYPQKVTSTDYADFREKLDPRKPDTFDEKDIFNRFISKSGLTEDSIVYSMIDDLESGSIFPFQTSPPLFYIPDQLTRDIVSPLIKNKANYTVTVDGHNVSKYIVLAPSVIRCNLLQMDSMILTSSGSNRGVSALLSPDYIGDSDSSPNFADFRAYLLYDYLVGYAQGSTAGVPLSRLKLQFPSNEIVSLGPVDNITVIDKHTEVDSDNNFKNQASPGGDWEPVNYYLNGDKIDKQTIDPAMENPNNAKNSGFWLTASQQLNGCAKGESPSPSVMSRFVPRLFESVALRNPAINLCAPALQESSAENSPAPAESPRLDPAGAKN